MDSTGLPRVPLDDRDSLYGYRPTLFVIVLYIALFSTTLGLHLMQTISSRYWFLAWTIVLGASLEVLGWSGRLWSFQDLFNKDPFTMQLVCLILAPTPLLAANFVILGRVVNLLGQDFSRLRPHLYTYIFLSCDILSLALQGVGGGLVATATDPDSSQFDLGTNLMIAGIVVQVTTMTVFIVLISEYAFRYVNNMPLRRTKKDPASHHSPLDTRRQILLFALVSTTLLLFIRAIYRLVELGGGWNGKVAQTEWFFNVFEAGLVTLAFFIWNVAHPSLLLQEHTPKNYGLNIGLKGGNHVVTAQYHALTDWQQDYRQ